jgi:hypothetical protein
MFSVFALQHDRNVPAVRYIRVRVEVESVGSGVMAGSSVSKDEIGYIPYAEVVVRTIRKDSRGFVRARYAASLRRREVVGSADEKFDSCAEASRGIVGSGCPVSLLSSFKRFLRRCGSSSETAAVAIVPDEAVSDASAGIAEAPLGESEVDLVLAFFNASEDSRPPLLLDPSSNRLAEKYVL